MKEEQKTVNTFLTKNDIFISIIFDPIYSNNFKSKHLIRLIKHRITTFNELTKALFIFNEQEIYKDKSFEELEKYILNENKKGNFDTIIIDSIQPYMTMGSELDLKGNKQKPDNMNITLINIENVNAGNTFESEKIYQLEKKVHYLETKITEQQKQFQAEQQKQIAEQQKQFETLVEIINENKNSPVL